METLIVDNDFDLYLQKIFESVTGPNTQLANFFVSLMEMIEILFLNIDSIRTHNWKAYLESLRLIMPWMHAYDNCNYGRWLPVSMIILLIQNIMKRFGEFYCICWFTHFIYIYNFSCC